MPQLYFSTDISCAWLLSAPVCNFVMQSGSDRACLWPYLARSLDQLNTVLVTHVRRLIEQFQHPIRTSDVSIVFWRINSGSIWTRIGHGPAQKITEVFSFQWSWTLEIARAQRRGTPKPHH